MSEVSQGVSHPVLTRLQVARLLGISAGKVDLMLKAGTLVRIAALGRAVRIPAWSVQNLIDGNPTQSPPGET